MKTVTPGTASGVRSLKYFVTPEGRAVKNGATWDYEYNLKDHLGNTRAVIKDSSGVAQVIQERHYYPFGMEMSELSSGSSTNKYLYNGKEYQTAFDLDWYDYGKRFYDPALARWHSVDPMAEKYYDLSPYTYCANNPIIYIDPDGNDLLIWYKNDQGKAASYRYTGGDVSHTNSFVNKVIEAYNYNVSNGGGKAMQTAATDNSVTVGITEYNDSKSWDGNTYWNPEMGLETKEGDVLSPATVLEHEVDHTYDEKKNPSEHEARKLIEDKNYDEAEERRVITGNETKTAKANGEIENKSVSRSSHHGNRKVIVNGGVSSTNVNQQKSNELNKKLEEQNANWSSEW